MKQVYPLKAKIRAAAAGEPTRVDVYDDIGDAGWAGGLGAKAFTAQLGKVKGDLEVHVNSAGGDVFDGIAIGNAITAHKGRKTIVVDGLAASIASVIAQAGDERVMQPGSMMMIHDAYGMAIGDSAEMAKMAETLDQVSGNLAGIYASRTGRTADEWRQDMKSETWYTADEAVAAGLADRVGDGGAELPAGLDVAAFAAPQRIAAALRQLPHAAPAKKRKKAAKPQDRLSEKKVRALVREEIRNAVDESAWDGPAAMSRAAASDDPAAALNAICAGKRDGDPATIAAHALPHHKNPGAPPNRAGVNNAVARLPQTQGLTNHDGAQAHLKAHQAAMGSGSSDHTGPGLAWTPGAFQTALMKGETT